MYYKWLLKLANNLHTPTIDSFLTTIFRIWAIVIFTYNNCMNEKGNIRTLYEVDIIAWRRDFWTQILKFPFSTTGTKYHNNINKSKVARKPNMYNTKYCHHTNTCRSKKKEKLTMSVSKDSAHVIKPLRLWHILVKSMESLGKLTNCLKFSEMQNMFKDKEVRLLKRNLLMWKLQLYW